MIKSFRIVNHLGESITIDIRKPEVTGFLISSVTGLNDPKAEISTTPYSTFDGSVVGNARVEQRNIVMNIIFYDWNKNKESIEDLRWKCYRYFPLRKQITFYVTNDHGTFWIKGYVESNEINIFSSQEANQISILCPDPYFTKDTVNSTAWVSQVVPLFQFPVSFEAIIPDDPHAPEINYQTVELVIGPDGNYYEKYDGSYRIVPRAYDQQVRTYMSYLENDMTIEKIPMTKTDNPSGGQTAKVG